MRTKTLQLFSGPYKHVDVMKYHCFKTALLFSQENRKWISADGRQKHWTC